MRTELHRDDIKGVCPELLLGNDARDGSLEQKVRIQLKELREAIHARKTHGVTIKGVNLVIETTDTHVGGPLTTLLNRDIGDVWIESREGQPLSPLSLT